MSKKHKHKSNNPQALSHSVHQGFHEHALEYKIIKHDLIRVIILNLLYLAGVLFLYRYDQKTHFLQHWFAKLLHF